VSRRDDELRSLRESNASLIATIRELTAAIEQQRAHHAAESRELTATIEKMRLEHAAQTRELNEKLDAALRRLHGKKSERRLRLPSPVILPAPSAAEIADKRASNQAQLAMRAVNLGEVEHEVREEDKVCHHCGEDADFRPVGDGRASDLFDYVPGYFRRSRHIVHTVACRCRKTILTADGPERVTPKSKYGPGLAALCITHKCLLGTPIHRLEKMLRGHGTPISRSTLNELLIRVAQKLEPIHKRLIDAVREADVVHADETPIRLLSHDKQAWVWVFIGNGTVAFVFDRSRASSVPERILGGTKGKLLTDGFSAYNAVTRGEGRTAARCHGHIRRKFHEALPTAKHAQEVLDLYSEIYAIEAEAKTEGLAGTEEHLRRRQKLIGPLLGKLKKWLLRTRKIAPPKSPLAKAIGYALGQWRGATRCLYDASIPLDNNVSERTIRVVAIGRKNFHGAGSVEGGEMLATLYSLAASCEAVGADPFAYFRDVIMRVDREDPRTLTPAAWVAAR
jgi:transposase